MKRIILTLALLLAPVAASAQCNGVFANNTICGNNSGASAPPKQVPLSALSGVAGGSPNQIQYNNAGAFGGFTMSGDGSVVVATGVFSLTPLGVTNPKLALMTQNTLKGAAVSTTPADLAVPSCSGAPNALQWVTNTGLQCATLVDGPASSTDKALARFNSTTGALIQNSEVTLGDTDGKLTRATGISISGTNTNDAAAAGYVGEIMTSQITFASRISLISSPTGVAVALVTMPVTAGDWDCSGVAGFETTGGGVASEYHIEISTTAPPTIVTAPNAGGTVGTHNNYVANQGQAFPVGPRQVLVNALTNVYFKVLSTFTFNQTGYAFLRCRRQR